MKRVISFSGFVFLLVLATSCSTTTTPATTEVAVKKDSLFVVPDTSAIPDNAFGNLVRYGRRLLLNTAYYIGPDGTVSHNLGNKMNCSNCHLNAGTIPYGLNFYSTHARYPQYRARENKVLTIEERVNNCIERPHSGKPLPLDGEEMRAIVCYIKWLGTGVPIDAHVPGDGLLKLKLPARAADPVSGEVVYKQQCATCHGNDGSGKLRADKVCYEYPPLWGVFSYQPGSSMHRVIKAAAFIYANMPNKSSSYDKPTLTMEQAFDVAAFINDDRIHKRPVNNGAINYPEIATKPIDYGVAPYTDTFPALQHKFGPWQPIIDYRKAKGLPVNF